MNARGLKLQALGLAVAFVVFAAAAPAEAACPRFGPCVVEYITWQTDVYGRVVPVVMSVPIQDTFIYRRALAEGRLLPAPIMTAVADRHPYGQITGATRGCCHWNISLCDQGRKFSMKVSHQGGVLDDRLN